MSDWNCQIVRIESITRHPDADSLDIVITSIGDYPIIARLGEWKVGDLCSYISIDSIVPDNDVFHFLCPKVSGTQTPRYEIGNVPEKYRRIKARRLRGIYSQGILVSAPSGFNIDDSVIDYFGLFKWEEDEEEASDPANKSNKKKIRTQNEKKPDGWSIPYYDITSLRKSLSKLEDSLADEEIVLSEKIHGANAAFSHDGEKLWVKSRNNFKRGEIEIPIFEDLSEERSENQERVRTQIGTKIVPSTDQWWDVARHANLEAKLAQYPGLVFFGELYGQVKGFRYDAEIVDGRVQSRVRFFDIWDTKTPRYLDYDDFCSICAHLGLDMAPELYRGPWLGKDKMYPLAEGKTTLGGKHIREGFVLKTTKERFCQCLNGRTQVKLVGEGYNLQK